MYPALIIAVSNCAPYLQHLSVAAATRLLQLLTAFSNPTFLLADEGHPRLLFFMYAARLRVRVPRLTHARRLETYNSILFHHPAENPNVLYALLRSHKTFEDLGTFTLAHGLREIRRMQQAKEEQESRAKTGDQHPQENDAGQEKVRLLQQEGVALPEHLDEPTSPTREVEIRAVDPETGHVSPPPPETSSTPDDALPLDESSRVGRMSEKARGKMKARSDSIDADASLERIAAAGVGRNGFIPTQEWVRVRHSLRRRVI